MEARRDLDVNSIEPDPKRIKEGWDPIVFTEADSHGVDVRPNDALVISARIGHREVHRILIDNGSSADILSAEVYDQLRLDRKDLQPFPTPLRGFGGVEVRSLGTVKLPVKIGKAPCQKTVLLDFVVVDTENWPYNALLGRPFLNKAKAVTATYALMMKFPTEYGVGVVKGSQEMARRANLSVYKDREVRQVYMVTVQQKAREPEEQAEVPKDFELDPREGPEDREDEPTQEVALDPEDPGRTVKVGASLSVHVKTVLIALLRNYKDVFAWSHEDMLGVDPKVISHHLSTNPEFRPVVQKRRLFNPERSVAIKKEVEKLLSAGSIREVKYPEWVANVVLVKKKNKQWRMCVDFTDLNKACPKDSFPLPRIDQLVDATAGHELLSFMDAYSGYNQIRMNKADEEKTSFTTDQGLYCYKVMPFGLKNAGATYQRLVNRMFARQIGKNMEVYVDDMLTKSTTAEKHTEDLKETFDVLRKYQMKLNPSKCVFGVPSGRFLGFQVHQRGIEVNPEKIKALEGMASPRTLKDVQRLTGCLASLNRFIAKSTDKCAPFFKAIKKGKGLEWSTECEEAFQKLKEYLGRAPILSKPVVGETLYLYLSVTEVATSSVLIRLEEGIQKPVKLRPYFQAHTIEVYTDCPLKLILQKPEVSGRLTKWAVELSEYDIRYTPKAAIKGQAVSDFIAEFTEPDAEVRRAMEDEQTTKFQWKLHVDGSSNTHGSGAGIVITTPEGDTVECAMRFDFKATNNQAEYEALLAGLRVCIALGADELEVYSDSQVVVHQVLDEYQAREEHMIAYLDIAKKLLKKFKAYRISQIPREENEKADALSKLASATTSIRSKAIPVAHLAKPTKRIRYRSARYTILRGELYRRGFSKVLQRCISGEKTGEILRSIHSGVCGNHTGGKSLAHKILRQGFYWPTLFAEAQQFAESCETCQRVANDIRRPPELLRSLTSPWPFAMWGLDLIGPMPTGTKGGAKHAIVAVDYFTKWAEAEALVHITEANTTSFVKKNIIYRFGIPSIIITDNGTQFDNKKFREMCEEFKIANYYASPAHPQTNGQTEAVNKVIKHTLKAKLEAKKGGWADKLPEVLWAYRTTVRSSTGETPFALAFGTEAVIPAETTFTSPRVQLYNPEHNIDMLQQNLDELEEVRDAAQVRNSAYRQRAARYYNSHVREQRFQLGDLVLRRVSPNTKDKSSGSLADKWEGPYIIKRIVGHGAYMIARPEGSLVPRPCNAQYLKIFYP
ncbi:hypothetical protein LWI29_008372 [Acer saccharum]|uniref:Uncharacterized protein n=1 Tax=Acer saccharum TaxID=4024 RepID=A0AA39VMP1_ACESA|nr:hypothetical protein LWI29_008372 [Acer saccharum]